MQLINNEIRQPNFRSIPNTAYKQDLSSALLMMPQQVLIIQDVRCCYTCKVGSIGDMEIGDLYEKLCENIILKEEYNIIERKGLTCALNFPKIFRIEWINIVLSMIHENSMWL